MKSEAEHISEFIATGKFPEGAIFKKLSIQGLWQYTCPFCKDDEYCLAGLCDGNFKCNIRSLKRGELPCRCSKKARLSGEQWTYRVRKECEKRSYTFLRWTTEKIGSHHKFECECKIHGKFSLAPNTLLKGTGCAKCVNVNQTQAYVNVIKDGEVDLGIKYGITNETTIRLRHQNKRNALKMVNLCVFKFPNSDLAKLAELTCKKRLGKPLLKRLDLVDGWTETTHINNLGIVISTYKEFGGTEMK